MAVQDKFSTMELLIRRLYKAHDQRGFNHIENTVKDDEERVTEEKGERETNYTG